MSIITADRVQEIFSSTGTGSIVLGGAVTGYQAFNAVMVNGQTCYYCATDGTSWEVGLGTYTSAGNQLARTTILASSNGGAAVSWSSGVKNVWLDFPAALAQNVIGLNVPQSSFKNLVSSWQSNSTVQVSFDQMIVSQGLNGLAQLVSAPNGLTINSGASGAGGLDTGSLQSSTWYFIYIIYNPTTQSLAAIMSLSGGSLTLPSGYTYYSGIVSAVRTDGSSNFIGFVQYGRDWQYRVGNNLAGLPVLGAGTQGNVSTPTWQQINLNNGLLPGILPACKIKILITSEYGSSNTIGMFAPNSSYGAYNSSTNPPPLMTYNQGAVLGELLLEENFILIAQQIGVTSFVVGFSLNI